MYDFETESRYFAQVPGELEADAAAELLELGATRAEPAHRGVHFAAEPRVLYRICYSARLVNRVLAPLMSFPCRDADTLYRRALELNYSDFLEPTDTFAVFANVSGAEITHSQYAALRLKDAVADWFRDRRGQRPNVDRDNPDVQFALHVGSDRATLFLDAGLGALHRRGYRINGVEAPMQEVLAAAIVRYSGWTGERPLCDPFCGSGTLLAEAVMSYCRIPAAWQRRRFGFERLPNFDSALWAEERRALDGKIRPLPAGLVQGSDLSKQAITVARNNLSTLGQEDRIALQVADFRSLGNLEGYTLLANPPHGIRMGDPEEIRPLYVELGDFLKQKCQGSSAFIYVGDKSLAKAIGLRPSGKKPLFSGALDGRCCRYDIFSGGWRNKA